MTEKPTMKCMWRRGCDEQIVAAESWFGVCHHHLVVGLAESVLNRSWEYSREEGLQRLAADRRISRELAMEVAAVLGLPLQVPREHDGKPRQEATEYSQSRVAQVARALGIMRDRLRRTP